MAIRPTGPGALAALPPNAPGLFPAVLTLAVLALASCPSRQPTEPGTSDAPVPPQSTAPEPSAPGEETSTMPPYTSVRASAIAGSWYPGNPNDLSRLVDGYLAAGRASDALPLALIMPHAGYRFSGAIAGLAAAQVRGANVRRVWVLAPNHRVRLRGIGLYDVDAFQTPLGTLPTDRGMFDRLKGKTGFTVLTGGDNGEHALEIQLPLLQRALGGFELVPLLVGELDPERARAAAEVIRAELGPGDLVVASTDFTHFGANFDYYPFRTDVPANLDRLDHGAWAHLQTPDPEALHAYIVRTGATICGHNDLVLLTALVGPTAKGTEIAYTTSGKLTGDWTSSVSYLAGRLDGTPWSGRGPQSGTARLVAPETAQALLALARKTIEHWYTTGQRLEVDPSTLPSDATRVLGAFVTLEKAGELRGCIGEITPARAAWEAVRDRALDAALKDPRFPAVTADEIGSLTLDISLLGPSWRVNGPDDFIIGRHGIVLSSGWRRATFLPQVAPEQGWDRRTTLLHLARKAGIPQAEISRATVDVYEAQVVGEHGE